MIVPSSLPEVYPSPIILAPDLVYLVYPVYLLPIYLTSEAISLPIPDLKLLPPPLPKPKRGKRKKKKKHELWFLPPSESLPSLQPSQPRSGTVVSNPYLTPVLRTCCSLKSRDHPSSRGSRIDRYLHTYIHTYIPAYICTYLDSPYPSSVPITYLPNYSSFLISSTTDDLIPASPSRPALHPPSSSIPQSFLPPTSNLPSSAEVNPNPTHTPTHHSHDMITTSRSDPVP